MLRKFPPALKKHKPISENLIPNIILHTQKFDLSFKVEFEKQFNNNSNKNTSIKQN